MQVILATISNAGEPLDTRNYVRGIFLSHGASPQEGYESEEDPKMDREVWDLIVDGESNVRAQMAHLVRPSALG